MHEKDLVFAPFTDEQVAALKEYQENGYFVPYKCGGHHPDFRPKMLITRYGWLCPELECARTQNWADASAINTAGKPPPWTAY